MTVEQGTFATEGRRALHEQGWTESLDRLEALLKSRDPGYIAQRDEVNARTCRSALAISLPIGQYAGLDSAAGLAVDLLANDVSVARMARRFLDHREASLHEDCVQHSCVSWVHLRRRSS